MIDYSAFDEQDLKQYNGKLPGLPKISSPFTAVVVVTILLLILLLPILVNELSKPALLPIIAVIIFVAIKLTWNGRSSSIQSALFAKHNKFGYSWKGGYFKKLDGLGSVIGRAQMSNVISGHIQGQSFTLCGMYNERLMKNVMRVTLPNNYPHIILDAKQNDKIISSLHTIFPDNKEIVLEGNFPDYFRVFTATTPVETLQILTPELMLRMIDYTHRADIEIVGNQLMLICNFKFNTKEVLQMMFEAVEQILKDLGVDSNNSKVTFDSTSRILPTK